jgi:hypothetical protein
VEASLLACEFLSYRRSDRGDSSSVALNVYSVACAEDLLYLLPDVTKRFINGNFTYYCALHCTPKHCFYFRILRKFRRHQNVSGDNVIQHGKPRPICLIGFRLHCLHNCAADGYATLASLKKLLFKVGKKKQQLQSEGVIRAAFCQSERVAAAIT